MMSLEYIKEINKEKEQVAKKSGTEPYIAQHDGDENIRLAPHIGDYRPPNWKLIEVHFTDNSGIGGDDGVALSFRELLGKVKKGHGYAIIEAGQFQVYVAEFERV